MEEIKITIPESWGEVTIEQYQNLDYTSVSKMIQTLWNIGEYESEHLDMPFDDILHNLNFITNEPTPVFRRELHGCTLIDIDTLTVGDMEMLEILCKAFKENCHTVVAWMYRDEDSIEDRAERMRGLVTVEEMFGAIVYAGLFASVLAFDTEVTDVFDTLKRMTDNPDRTEYLAGNINQKELDAMNEMIKKLKR